jgi:hypothetical protein
MAEIRHSARKCAGIRGNVIDAPQFKSALPVGNSCDAGLDRLVGAGAAARAFAPLLSRRVASCAPRFVSAPRDRSWGAGALAPHQRLASERSHCQS